VKKRFDEQGNPKITPPPEKITALKFFQNTLLEVQQSFHDMN
jgi:hypothetical protein